MASFERFRRAEAYGAKHDREVREKEPLRFEGDDEEFCRRCLAGVHSSEHAEKCYYPGHAEMGESA